MRHLWVCNYTFIAEDKLRSNVQDKQPTFIRQTNWTFLLPHLVSVGLSDSATTDYLLNEHKSHQEKGVHFYNKVLPSKGPDAYTRFHRCLCDEKEHLGHHSLLQICDEWVYAWACAKVYYFRLWPLCPPHKKKLWFVLCRHAFHASNIFPYALWVCVKVCYLKLYGAPVFPHHHHKEQKNNNKQQTTSDLFFCHHVFHASCICNKTA